MILTALIQMPFHWRFRGSSKPDVKLSEDIHTLLVTDGGCFRLGVFFLLRPEMRIKPVLREQLIMCAAFANTTRIHH